MEDFPIQKEGLAEYETEEVCSRVKINNINKEGGSGKKDYVGEELKQISRKIIFFQKWKEKICRKCSQSV